MAAMMAAQVFYEPEKMEFKDMAVPAPGADEIRVRVNACGICGSDIAYYFGQSSLETPNGKGPLVLGHEFCGVVDDVGAIPEKLGLFQKGDRVVLDPVQYCNACEICKRGMPNLCEKKSVLGVSTNGGFAEYCLSNYTGVHKIPDNVSFEQAALTEPLACATYGVQNMQIKLGDFAVVLGAGVIGSLMLQLIKSSGAGKVLIVDTVDYRLDIAKKLGVDYAFNTLEKDSPYYIPDLKQKIQELTGGRFADACIVATGNVSAMEQALAITGRRARIVYFGLPADDAVVRVPALQSIFWDKTIRFSWLAPLTWPTALQAIANGLVNVDMIRSHNFALKDLIPGIAEARGRAGKAMKVVINP
ncbi:MAG: alcohol dehydrogenase catalytic domain-containing protein [Candidatus Omnitrophota bacterium]